MGDWRDAFTDLFRRHRARLEHLVRHRVPSSDVAADIVQDVFLRTFAAGPRASEDDDRRVLYASARNAMAEYHRTTRRRRRLMASVLPEQMTVGTASAESRVEARQALGSLEAALAELSPRCRSVFLMRRVEGLSNAEIARHHGISVNSVEKHIARALRHCQKSLSHHFGDA